MVNVNPIRNENDYEAALSMIDGLMDAEADTPEGDRFDVMVTLVDAYERKHYPIEAPDPVELIKFVMEQRGLKRKDLRSIIGNRNRVAEVLNRKRGLSLGMIRKLHTMLGLPADALLAEYPLQNAH